MPKIRFIRKIRVLAILLAAAVLLPVVSKPVYADKQSISDNELETEDSGFARYSQPFPSNNVHDHTYPWHWTERPYSFLFEDRGRIVRVEAQEKDNYCILRAEYYDKNYNFQYGMTSGLDLPKFGGFFKGSDGLYVVCGRDNYEDSPTAEVIRVIKYDFDLNRVGTVSFYGINTGEPFGAANVSMAECGDFIYIHSGHGIFQKAGVRHQTNMTLCFNKNTMTVASTACEVSGDNLSYVSHSFQQYVRVDGQHVIVMDHGDAYPRGIQLGYSESMASQGYVAGRENTNDYWGYGRINDYQTVTLMTFPGDDNSTGTMVGGFEVSSSNYITALTHVTLNDSYKANSDWNISLLLKPKDGFYGQNVREVKLTSDAGNGIEYDNPFLVKINDNLLVVMWEKVVDGGYPGEYCAVAVNGNGEPISDVATFKGTLSDCQPVVIDGKIIWYSTGGGNNHGRAIYNSSNDTITWGNARTSGPDSAPTFYQLTPVEVDGSCLLIDSNAGAEGVSATMAFVSRLYTTILKREPDRNGLMYWTRLLLTKEKTGAEVAAGFIGSTEFKEQGNGNSSYVKKLYRAFFDREPDAGGYNMWMSRLDTGADRDYVLAGFTNSAEFSNLCLRFGIERGSLDDALLATGDDSKSGNYLLLDSSDVDVNKLDEYVRRLYSQILNRECADEEVRYWREQILADDAYDAATAARIGFFTSKEYLAKNRTNEEFITDAYHAFFGREPDASGFSYWQQQLSSGGYTRDNMIDVGFGHSEEFKALLRSYGFKM